LVLAVDHRAVSKSNQQGLSRAAQRPDEVKTLLQMCDPLNGCGWLSIADDFTFTCYKARIQLTEAWE
jgi:hypothetical protein